MNHDRRRRIVLLLGSLYDGLPAPNGYHTPSGFGPVSFEPCPACSGAGRTRDRYGRRSTCTRCQGKRRLAYDPMDAQRVPVGSTATTVTAKAPATVRCDACAGDGAHGNGRRCTHCDGSGRRVIPSLDLTVDDATDAADLADRWNDAIARRDQSGSYQELEHALAALRRANYTAARLIERVHIVKDKPEHDLSLLSREKLAFALRYLDLRMPDPIRVPAQVVANARELEQRRTRVDGRSRHRQAVSHRDAEIRAHIRAGRSPQWVAAEYGLSVRTVYEIANGNERTG